MELKNILKYLISVFLGLIIGNMLFKNVDQELIVISN